MNPFFQPLIWINTLVILGVLLALRAENRKSNEALAHIADTLARVEQIALRTLEQVTFQTGERH